MVIKSEKISLIYLTNFKNDQLKIGLSVLRKTISTAKLGRDVSRSHQQGQRLAFSQVKVNRFFVNPVNVPILPVTPSSKCDNTYFPELSLYHLCIF